MLIDSESGKVSLAENECGKSVVILSHGYLSDKNSGTNRELTNLLSKAGISTITYDLYGHGESEGDVEHLTISKAVDSLEAVFRYAKKYEKIALVGSSFTGSVTLIAASRNNPDAIALKCPVFEPLELYDWRLGEKGIEKWKKDGFIEPFGRKWYYDIYEDAGNYDMPRIASKIECPIISVHGNKDVTVPIAHSENLIHYCSSKEKRLVEIKGADHFFKSHFGLMTNIIADWLTDHLNSQ